jgi:hypothetical protein
MVAPAAGGERDRPRAEAADTAGAAGDSAPAVPEDVAAGGAAAAPAAPKDVAAGGAAAAPAAPKDGSSTPSPNREGSGHLGRGGGGTHADSDEDPGGGPRLRGRIGDDVKAHDAASAEYSEESSQAGNDSGEETRQARAPWHFKILLVGTVVYLGWRLYQGIGWLVHHV